MVSVSLRELLEAGVHFGHQTGRWNPKMKPYIVAKKNGIYIIDLQKTRHAWSEALQYVEEQAAQGGKILFVGTKRQARDIVAEEAQRAGQYYVNHRWLGGLLTNYATISRSIQRYRDLEAMAEDGRFELLPKKEVLKLNRELFKLKRNLIGIVDMNGLPDVVFVIDIRRERIAVDEALRLRIPVVAVVDTNCDPDRIDYVVPGNDDAIRSIRLFCSLAADAALSGGATYQENVDAAEAAKLLEREARRAEEEAVRAAAAKKDAIAAQAAVAAKAKAEEKAKPLEKPNVKAAQKPAAKAAKKKPAAKSAKSAKKPAAKADATTSSKDESAAD